VILRGERILLRPVAEPDVARLAEILQDPEIAAWWPRYDAARVRSEFVDPDDEEAYAVELGGEPIGLLLINEELEPEYRHASLDITLATIHHGRGLGAEALRVAARHLFEERGHHRITIDPAAHNERAIRAYERVGFRPVGVMREYELGPDGTWHDGLLMDLLASDFEG
jgi:aminoglycoside 6'-N-acetyltransferase